MDNNLVDSYTVFKSTLQNIYKHDNNNGNHNDNNITKSKFLSKASEIYYYDHNILKKNKTHNPINIKFYEKKN